MVFISIVFPLALILACEKVVVVSTVHVTMLSIGDSDVTVVTVKTVVVVDNPNCSAMPPRTQLPLDELRVILPSFILPVIP